MSSSLIFWIVAGLLIVAATILIVWIRHNFKVKKVTFKTGLMETELERNEKTHNETPAGASVNISGNKMIGKNRVSVRREKTNVSGNTMAGENQIDVGGKPGPTPKRRKTGKKK